MAFCLAKRLEFRHRLNISKVFDQLKSECIFLDFPASVIVLNLAIGGFRNSIRIDRYADKH